MIYHIELEAHFNAIIDRVNAGDIGYDTGTELYELIGRYH